MIIAAGIIWAAIAWVTAARGDTHAAEHALRHNLLEYAELMLFLLVAMGYGESGIGYFLVPMLVILTMGRVLVDDRKAQTIQPGYPWRIFNRRPVLVPAVCSGAWPFLPGADLG